MTVYNMAVPSTGSGMASFCLDSLLPQGVRLDFLLVEFATNDAVASDMNPRAANRYALHWKALNKMVDGQRMDPRVSLERLLRRVLRSMPGTVPILLNVCGPKRPQCPNLYHEVATFYRIREIFVVSPVVSNSTPHVAHSESVLETRDWERRLGVHPGSKAHAMTAQLIHHVIQGYKAQPQAGSKGRRLPPPRFLNRSWEGVDSQWRCRTCTMADCSALVPIRPPVSRSLSGGFRVEGHTSPNFMSDRNAWKHGWTASLENATLGFRVPGSPSRVLLALLCSYENVGQVAIELAPLSRQQAPFSSPLSSPSKLDLRWMSNSSQQCIADAGVAQAAEDHAIWLRVLSPTRPGRNEVKVYGVYYS